MTAAIRPHPGPRPPTAAHVSHYGLWERPVWWYGPVFALWMCGVGVTILLLTGRRSGMAMALAPFSVAVGAAMILMHAGGGVWELNRDRGAHVR